MITPSEQIAATFGNQVRVRVCGLCIQQDSILLVRHHFIGKNGELWSPPGGGLEFGESATVALKREFLEETGLDVEVGRFLFVHEYVNSPLHAVELFFEVIIKNGRVQTGYDPEMDQANQLIKEVDFLSMKQIKSLPKENLHYMLRELDHPDTLLNQKGYFISH